MQIPPNFSPTVVGIQSNWTPWFFSSRGWGVWPHFLYVWLPLFQFSFPAGGLRGWWGFWPVGLCLGVSGNDGGRGGELIRKWSDECPLNTMVFIISVIVLSFMILNFQGNFPLVSGCGQQHYWDFYVNSLHWCAWALERVLSLSVCKVIRC